MTAKFASDHIASPSGHLSLGECVVDLPGRSSWHSHRVGPFRSTGGFDYWSLSHSAFSSITRVLDGLLEGEQVRGFD